MKKKDKRGKKVVFCVGVLRLEGTGVPRTTLAIRTGRSNSESRDVSV